MSIPTHFFILFLQHILLPSCSVFGSTTICYSSMDLTNIAIWVTTVVVIFITAVVTKIIVTGRKATFQPVCNRARPPVVNGASLIKLVHVGLTKGLQAMVHDQYRALGSVFTLRFFRVNITFLVGPEGLDHFFKG